MSVTNAEKYAVVQKLMEDIKTCETLASVDRLAEAYDKFKEIKKRVKTLEEPTQEDFRKYFDSSTVIKQVNIEGKELFEALRLVQDVSQWNLWNNNIGPRQDVSVYTSRQETRGIYHFKITGELQKPLKEILPALLENSLYQYWVPMCAHSENIISPSANRRIVKTDFNFVLFHKTAVTDR
jgi:cell fate (sporulation/competence/biofilm development) regulator YlbF (YheA/YmcA/DUF963 family)